MKRLALKSRVFPLLRVLKVIVAATALAGCADLPRDQHGATSRIQESRVLTVGIPDERSVSEVMQREREIIDKVAQRLGAKIEYKRGDSHQLLQNLENLKYPLVAAALPSDSPFSQSVGMSQPYWKNGPERKDYCIAVAPGENRLLFIVDQVILEDQKSRSAKVLKTRHASTRMGGES